MSLETTKKVGKWGQQLCPHRKEWQLQKLTQDKSKIPVRGTKFRKLDSCGILMKTCNMLTKEPRIPNTSFSNIATPKTMEAGM